MGTQLTSWARRGTPAPEPLRRRAVDAPAPFAPDEFADIRRAMAIELVLEAQQAEDGGASPSVVEALRDKARTVLGTTPPARNMAPPPLAMRRTTDELHRTLVA